MKAFRLIAAVVLLACAGAAAYYSYKVNFAAPLPPAANGGPPVGISMPRMGPTPAGQGKGGNAPKGGIAPRGEHRKGAG